MCQLAIQIWRTFCFLTRQPLVACREEQPVFYVGCLYEQKRIDFSERLAALMIERSASAKHAGEICQSQLVVWRSRAFDPGSCPAVVAISIGRLSGVAGVGFTVVAMSVDGGALY